MDINLLIFGDAILKKILFGFLMLFSSVIFAKNNPVIVKITNATGTDCVLEKQTALYGYVSDPTTVPHAIFSDQTIVFRMQSEEGRRKLILLTYTCGDNGIASFFTDITPFQGMFLSHGYVLKTNKIHLYFSEEHNDTGHIADNSPIVVQWRLTR